MPRVVFGARALHDLERIAGFRASDDPGAAEKTIETILGAVAILARHPLIGRPARGTMRELVISSGATGFVALYRHRPVLDRVEILAVRHQREAGFA